MRLAQIEGGVVVNMVEVDPEAIPDWAADWPEVTGDAGPGWTWDGVMFTPPAAPDEAALRAARRPEMALSLPQLLIGLVTMGWISEAEGDAWATATALPPTIVALINGLPEDQRFAVRVRALRMSQAERLDPITVALAALQGVSDADMDIFFETFAAV